MTATNMCSNFGGFRCSLKIVRCEAVENYVFLEIHNW